MKFLIVSDSHGMSYELDDLLNEYKNFDGYIHCGDSELNKNELSNWEACLGNTDYNGLPDFIVLNIGKKKALITHSHRIGPVGVEIGLASLAKENECDYVFFGHTHRFTDENIRGVRIMNPGSLFRSRDDGSHSYAIFETDENGDKAIFKRYKL